MRCPTCGAFASTITTCARACIRAVWRVATRMGGLSHLRRLSLATSRALGARRNDMPRQKIPTPRLLNCRVCAEVLPQSGFRVAFCGDDCRKQYARDYARRCNVVATSSKRSERNCQECQSIFTPIYGDKRRSFCSAICLKKNTGRVQKAKRRAKIRAVKIEAVNPIKVFKRDGWRCHICARATPMVHRGTQKPTAPELDHIVPLSLGGDHSYGNTACCCRQCNHRKGARILGQPSLLAA
jgi:5-methylcytosine-specific restriction endonuclease McrA